jgi:hypothetical protein
MRRSRRLTDTRRKQPICRTVRRRLSRYKVGCCWNVWEEVSRESRREDRTRQGTHHWRRHMGAWQIVRIRGNKKRLLSQRWAIDRDWSRGCGCVSTISGILRIGLCRALYRRGNFQFSCESFSSPTPCLLACWQPSLLALCPILEHFAYWGFSFLVSGPAPNKKARSYGGLGDWGSRICWPELRSFFLWPCWVCR